MIATDLSKINFYKKIFMNLTPCQDTLPGELIRYI